MKQILVRDARPYFELRSRPRACAAGTPMKRVGSGFSDAAKNIIVLIVSFNGFCLDCSGGEGGIRTLDECLTHTPLAGERLQPLGHLSEGAKNTGGAMRIPVF